MIWIIVSTIVVFIVGLLAIVAFGSALLAAVIEIFTTIFGGKDSNGK